MNALLWIGIGGFAAYCLVAWVVGFCVVSLGAVIGRALATFVVGFMVWPAQVPGPDYGWEKRFIFRTVLAFPFTWPVYLIRDAMESRRAHAQ